MINKSKNKRKKILRNRSSKISFNNINSINKNINLYNQQTKISQYNNNDDRKIKKFKFQTESKNEHNLHFLEYKDFELNILEYSFALNYDRRTYVQFYISLLKIKHLLIFSFYPTKDYNSKIIKIFLFFYFSFNN